MEQKSNKKLLAIIVWLSFILFTAWWLYITLVIKSTDHYNNINNQVFAASYGIVSLLGGIAGVLGSRLWGGYKSLLGRSLLFFALGLLAQEFGQIAYSIYLYALHVKIPYPSIGDIGYFSSVFFYIYASYLLLKANGGGISLKNSKAKKAIAVILPAILLTVSYIYFLHGYKFDFSSTKSALTVVLDLGYPLGQATYISIALLTYLLSRKMLGGIMKNKILLILFALVVQYVADFTFLKDAKAGSIFPAGANDYIYLVSYTVMAIALNNFRFRLVSSKQVTSDDKSTETVV